MISNSKSEEAVGKISNDRLEDLIDAALRQRMTEQDCELTIDEIDIAIRKEVGRPIFADITVYGLAGNTTKDEFATKDAKGNVEVIKGGGSIAVTLDDDTAVKFVFDGITNLNATDYLVTYRLA